MIVEENYSDVMQSSEPSSMFQSEKTNKAPFANTLYM